ncbi:hypothetical protein E2562_031031 [Oryza meyeriana var. granulata]|uniref:Uncharacterized protein n=1 Tax=Oryza meyeriana var. granulata TaxID=110450 RepID=A0A6G1FEE0_9ORYZ|nr:hypothetical protein E2562_031031 [Oryza meyeriana var. granulata]
MVIRQYTTTSKGLLGTAASLPISPRSIPIDSCASSSDRRGGGGGSRRRRPEGEQAAAAEGEQAAAAEGEQAERRRRAAHRLGPRCILLCIPSLHGARAAEGE